jgi:hypothetical protein
MKTNWDLLIENHYAKKKSLSLDFLMESVREVMGEMPVKDPYLLSEADAAGTTLSWSSIPDVPISEIGWSAMQTRDGVEVPSEQRSQLSQFLSGIAPGEDLIQKLDSLSEFYRMDEAVISSFQTGDIKENIGKALSYLVFFKTLTQILTQFNAASAGFSFESFLGVLLGGKQVPTGEGTIADLTDANGVPISLKLYKEGQLEVGGSFTDLSRDLRKNEYNNTMQYIAVTKNLSGKEMEQEGTLNWYRFNFNLVNVYNIIARSSEQSRKNILLPKVFIASNGKSVEGVPEKATSLPSAEEMEEQFLDLLRVEIEKNQKEISADTPNLNLDQLKQDINFAKEDALFSKITKGGEKIVIRGKSKLGGDVIAKLVYAKYLTDNDRYRSWASARKSPLKQAILNADTMLRRRYARDEQQARRQTTLNEMYFYDGLSEAELIERSRVFYNAASPELKIRCLEIAYGYVANGHFNLTQGMVTKITALAGENPGALFPDGQAQVGIGQLEIGAVNVQRVLNGLAGILNQNIFEIFENLKILTTNIQGYFAGGLSDDSKATTAIAAAEEIETKTAEVADVE